MSKEIQRQTHTIDAANQAPGRLASRIAMILRGKNKASFTPNIDAGDIVVVENVSKMKITGNKLVNKIYYRHSTHPGGLKAIKLGELIARKGYGEVLRHAVSGMVHRNRLKSEIMKRLIIK